MFIFFEKNVLIKLNVYLYIVLINKHMHGIN